MILPKDGDTSGRLQPQPRFAVGQLVRHRRYGYRGVVVERDTTCQADESWHRSNRTQPDRDQPWYHVLVHGTPTNTYAAESSLFADPSGLPIDHPLVDVYFHGFDGGAYERNDEPWQGRW